MANTYGTKGAPAVGGGAPGLPIRTVESAFQVFYTNTTSGASAAPYSFSLFVPPGVTKIDAVCVGGGQGGSSGGLSTSGNGGLGGSVRWITGLPVVPGEVLTVTVGHAGQGQVSNTTTISRHGGTSSIDRGGVFLLRAVGGGVSTANNTVLGQQADGSFVGGGAGGDNGTSGAATGGSGGGAGGYYGNGGAGGNTTGATAGTGGAGGGGLSQSTYGGSGGGGVGIFQFGDSGSAGVASTYYGTGGSQGSDGTAGNSQDGGTGGDYGGGGGGSSDGSSAGNSGGDGGAGAVRIIWGGGRTYPNNSSQNLMS